MAEAQVRQLYTEARCGSEAIFPCNEVYVSLRRWESDENIDYVLYVLCRIDDKVTTSGKRAVDVNDDSAAIRHAIEVFDRAIAEHPTLGGDNS